MRMIVCIAEAGLHLVHDAALLNHSEAEWLRLGRVRSHITFSFIIKLARCWLLKGNKKLVL